MLFVSNLSISLRTLLLLFYPPHLRGESGCKDKYFYTFPPNLSALFFKLFFGTAVEESFCRLHPQKMKNTSVKMFQNLRFVSESGCKGKDFFINSKLFKEIFEGFFKPRPGQYSEELCTTQNSGNQPFTTTHLRYWFNPSFPDCGCKDRTIYTPSPNFLSTFFRKK